MRTITVIGHGSATATPDRAVVRVVVAFRASGLAEALAGASSAGDLVVAVARGHVDAPRVGSQDLSVWPAHDDEGRPAGFEARHSYRIACDSLDVAGALLGELATRVGDRLQVEGVSLEVAEPGAVEVAAREAAYADARDRAEQLASLAGVTLGDVQAVVEGGGGAVTQRGDVSAAYSSKLELSFEPGQSAWGLSLTVTWAVV